LPNTTLEEACSEALTLAKEMNIHVEFIFEGYLIRVDKEDQIQAKIDFYNEAINSRNLREVGIKG
jgi:hypothetical protein